jgi:hypothetical protein
LTPRPEPSQAAARESPSDNEKEPSWRKQIVIGAALALVGAVAARAVGVVPSPFGHEGLEPSGAIQLGETLRNQTRGMFLGTEVTPQADDEFGLVLDLQRTSENTSPHGCRIVWSYIDPKVPSTVSDKTLVDQPARDVKGDPTACRGGVRIWVPLKPTLDTYERVRVRVELFADDKQLGIPAETEDIPLG